MKDNRKRELLNPQKILKCLISSTKGLRSLNTDTDLDCPRLNKENKLPFLQKLMSLVWDRLACHRDTSMQKEDATAGHRICAGLSSAPRQRIYAFKSKCFSEQSKPAVPATTRQREGGGLWELPGVLLPGVPPLLPGVPPLLPAAAPQAGGWGGGGRRPPFPFRPARRRPSRNGELEASPEELAGEEEEEEEKKRSKHTPPPKSHAKPTHPGA